MSFGGVAQPQLRPVWHLRLPDSSLSNFGMVHKAEVVLYKLWNDFANRSLDDLQNHPTKCQADFLDF